MKLSARSGGIAGIVAGLGYIVQAVMGLVRPQTEVFSGTSDYVLEWVFIVALLATILALMGLHTFARDRYGRPGTSGFWMAVIGTVLMLASALVTLSAGQNSLGEIFVVGMLMAIVGYVRLGLAALRAKVFPLWLGLALVAGFPLSVFLAGYGGGLLLGAAWLSVGVFLLKQSPAS